MIRIDLQRGGVFYNGVFSSHYTDLINAQHFHFRLIKIIWPNFIWENTWRKYCSDFTAPSGQFMMGYSYHVTTVSSTVVLLRLWYSNWKGQVNDILRYLGRDVVSCRLLRIVYLRLIYTQWKRTRKQIFFFDLCSCSKWTLNWIIYESNWNQCRFRFNINELLCFSMTCHSFTLLCIVYNVFIVRRWATNILNNLSF